MNQVEQSSFRYLDFYLLGILVLVAGFFAQDGASILQGLWQITLSPSQLISDYMLIGGVGAAFVNSALVYLMMVALAHYLKSELTGILIAGLLTVLGFGFFGKHILNSIPLIMGVYLYTEIPRHSIFSTSSCGVLCDRDFAGGQLYRFGTRVATMDLNSCCNPSGSLNWYDCDSVSGAHAELSQGL